MAESLPKNQVRRADTRPDRQDRIRRITEMIRKGEYDIDTKLDAILEDLLRDVHRR